MRFTFLDDKCVKNATFSMKNALFAIWCLSVWAALVLQLKFSRDFLQSFCYYQEGVFLNAHFSSEKEEEIVQVKEQRGSTIKQ